MTTYPKHRIVKVTEKTPTSVVLTSIYFPFSSKYFGANQINKLASLDTNKLYGLGVQDKNKKFTLEEVNENGTTS